MSEYEQPGRLEREPTVEDVRQLMGASAPHFAMHLRNRIRTLISGLPQDHPEEWKQSSPITFANQLKGNLMIIHGTGDDNVHYQATEALINALIVANKQFSVFPYPNRSHSISEGTGTQRHLLGQMTKFIHEKLPAGPAPATTSSVR